MPYSFPSITVQWGATSIAALVCQPGYMSPNDWRPVTAIAVALAESQGNPLAVSPVRLKNGPDDKSLDIGMWQLNTHWCCTVDPYPDVPRIRVAECFDPFAAWDLTWKLINKGRIGWSYNWTRWSTYSRGAQEAYYSRATMGLREYCKLVGEPGV